MGRKSTRLKLVTLKNNKAITTSLKIAEKFGKRHDNVLRSIKNLIKKGAKGFILSEYTNKCNVEHPMYTINKDSFIALSMGYTGRKAYKIKETYLNKFAQIEKQALQCNKNYTYSETITKAVKKRKKV
jgi:Rha family phage regulatory protein